MALTSGFPGTALATTRADATAAATTHAGDHNNANDQINKLTAEVTALENLLLWNSGEVFFDTFAGADDDAKLAAAMTYAAAQTYPPVIRMGARLHTFATNSIHPYHGLAICGVPGEHTDAADDGTGGGRKTEIALTFDSTSSNVGWFHNTDTSDFIRGVSFTNLNFRDTSGGSTSHPSIWTQASDSVPGYELGLWYNISASGMWSVLGAPSQRLFITACVTAGPGWNINNGWEQQIYLCGSDNNLFMDGCLIDSLAANHPSSGAGRYHMTLSYLDKTNIGPMYITAESKWGAVYINGPDYNSGTGSNGGPLVFHPGFRAEGRNKGAPSYGNLIRIDGGQAVFTGAWFGFGMSAAASTGRSPQDAGIIHCTGGALTINSATYGDATGVAQSVPFVYATSDAYVDVAHITVGSQDGAWSTLPVVSDNTTWPGRVITDRTVSCSTRFDAEFQLNGGNEYRSNFPRHEAGGTSITLSAGVGYLVALPLKAGDIVTNLTVVNGSQALVAGTGPHLFVALYDTTKTKIDQSTDEGGATAWAADAVKTKALAGGAYTVPKTGSYYVELMVDCGSGGTMPLPKGKTSTLSVTKAVLTGMAQLCGSNGSGLTTTAPAGPLTIADAADKLFWVCTS